MHPQSLDTDIHKDEALPRCLFDIRLALQDKVGPFCRAAEDCAIVFDVLRGHEDSDPSSRDAKLQDPWAIPVSSLTIGVLPTAEEYLQEVCPQRSHVISTSSSGFDVCLKWRAYQMESLSIVLWLCLAALLAST